MKSHIKTSFASLRRAPFQALAAISSLGLTFFVATFVGILLFASSKALIYFETRPQIIAFLKNDVTVQSISALQDKLKADARVKDLNFVSKERALELYKSSTSDNPLLGELVSPSTLPASLEFSVKDLSDANKVIDDVKKEDAVDSIGFTASLGGQSTLSDVIGRLKRIGLYIRVGGLVFVSVLLITSFFVLMIVIGMRITTKRSEIETLSLIGAKPGFIRTPIVLEGINYAILGSFIGWLVASIIILYVTPSIISFFGSITILPKNSLEFFELLGIILGIEMLVSIVIAVIASNVAISRALPNKK